MMLPDEIELPEALAKRYDELLAKEDGIRKATEYLIQTTGKLLQDLHEQKDILGQETAKLAGLSLEILRANYSLSKRQGSLTILERNKEESVEGQEKEKCPDCGGYHDEKELPEEIIKKLAAAGISMLGKPIQISAEQAKKLMGGQ